MKPRSPKAFHYHQATRSFDQIVEEARRGRYAVTQMAYSDADQEFIDNILPLKEQIHRIIIITLGITGGNKAKAARILGINVKTIYNHIRQFKCVGENQLEVDGNPKITDTR